MLSAAKSKISGERMSLKAKIGCQRQKLWGKKTILCGSSTCLSRRCGMLEINFAANCLASLFATFRRDHGPTPDYAAGDAARRRREDPSSLSLISDAMYFWKAVLSLPVSFDNMTTRQSRKMHPGALFIHDTRTLSFLSVIRGHPRILALSIALSAQRSHRLAQDG